LATAEYVKGGELASLLLLADGNFTISRAYHKKRAPLATEKEPTTTNDN
jgi:hypothetical protein